MTMPIDSTDEIRIREIVKEELAGINPPKKKRAPNKWQIFLKDCAKNEPGSNYPEKVKACSVKYREKKNNGQLPDNNPPPPPPPPPPPQE